MAFQREGIVSPIGIGDISVDLFDPVPGSTEPRSATSSIQVMRDDGSVRVIKVNLVGQLPNSVIQQLVDLMGMIRTKAMAEILPEGVSNGVA